MNNIYFDTRWIGDHGIGRFAAELQERLNLQDLGSAGSPSSPLDPLRMLVHLWRLSPGKIVFSPGYNAPLLMPRPYVFTIHDLNHIDVPDNSSIIKRLYYHLVLKQACKKASRVLTVSKFSRRRIIEWSGVSEDKIVNVGNGVDSIYRPDGERYHSVFPYLLCVGNRKPHKNEVRALRAFAQADIPSDIHLYFTGNASPELTSLAHELGVGERIRFLGHVEEEHLPALYRGALGLFFPSLYEGFGLPVVEAMACGTPVLTSNVTALPEVAGDAALLVNPYDVQSICDGLEQLVTYSSLRERLQRKGLERAALFSWDEVARRVENTLEVVVKESGIHD